MEAKLAAAFYHYKDVVVIHLTLEKWATNNPALIVTDNATVDRLLTNTMIVTASNSVGMRYSWLKCHRARQQFRFPWHTGANNSLNLTSPFG